MADKSFWNDKKDRVWLQNFWYYYKFAVLGGAVAIAVVVSAIVSIVTQVQPDLTVYYMGNYPLSDAIEKQTEHAFVQLIDDADGKDGVHLSFENMTQIDTPRDAADFAMREVAMVKIAEGDGFLYILTQAQFESYLETGIFEDISDIINDDGPVYGICLNDNTVMGELGYADDGNLWMAVRILRSGKVKQQEKNMQENAKKVLRHVYLAGTAD